MDKMKLQEIFPIGTKYSAYRDRTDKNWEKTLVICKNAAWTRSGSMLHGEP